MTKDELFEWYSKYSNSLKPPGCECDYLRSPSNPEKAITVGVVHNHRFAFYYWSRFNHEKRNAEIPPILVTLDAHDDVGVPSDVEAVKEDLLKLNLGSDLDLGLFCWLRLHPLDDGHILPALFMNYFSDVYVVRNFKSTSSDIRCESFKDRNDKIHNVFTVTSTAELLQVLPQSGNIYLDIDLDYFTTPESLRGNKGAEQIVSDHEISSSLSLKEPFLISLFPRLVGMTIALEPTYCGGMANSLHILSILNTEIFRGTLFKDSSSWNI